METILPIILYVSAPLAFLGISIFFARWMHRNVIVEETTLTAEFQPVGSTTISMPI